jgi:hypothetical protein
MAGPRLVGWSSPKVAAKLPGSASSKILPIISTRSRTTFIRGLAFMEFLRPLPTWEDYAEFIGNGREKNLHRHNCASAIKIERGHYFTFLVPAKSLGLISVIGRRSLNSEGARDMDFGTWFNRAVTTFIMRLNPLQLFDTIPLPGNACNLLSKRTFRYCRFEPRARAARMLDNSQFAPG